MMKNKIVIKQWFVENIKQWEEELYHFDYSLFHLPQWIESIADDQHTSVYLDFLIDNNIIAKVSGLIFDMGLFRGKQLHLYVGPTINESGLKYSDQIYLSLLHWAKTQRVSRIVIGSYDLQQRTPINVKGFYPSPRVEYSIYFNQENGQGKFSTGFKKNVTRAKRIDTTFHEGNSDDVFDTMLTLIGITHHKRVGKYGSDYDPFYMHKMTINSLKTMLKTGFAKLHYTLQDGNINCVQYTIEHNGRACALLIGSNDFAYQNGMPAFIDFTLIDRFKAENFERYNTGGSTTRTGGDGLERYKMSMGCIKLEVEGATTNFLTFPKNLINPLLVLGRKLPYNKLTFLNAIRSRL